MRANSHNVSIISDGISNHLRHQRSNPSRSAVDQDFLGASQFGLLNQTQGRATSYGQPGSSWAPQSYGALKRWGMDIYLDAGSHVNLDDRPCYYGGVLNFYKLAHTLRTNLGGGPRWNLEGAAWVG